MSKTQSIDEQLAWALLRAVKQRNVPDHPTRVYHDPRPDVWLQVYPSGRWKTSAPPSDAARELLDLYAPLSIGRDLIIAQMGQSLDGRIATERGDSHYITGPADIQHLHRLRALVDAVVVGAATVDSDDPQLTVREVDGHTPVRVVIDPHKRVDRRSRIFSDGAATTIAIQQDTSDQQTTDNVILCRPGPSGMLDPRDIVEALRTRGCRRLLVEGGGVTVSRFVDAGVIDRLHVTVAPMVIGSGRASFTLNPIATLDDAVRPQCRLFRLGEDVLFDLDLRQQRRT